MNFQPGAKVLVDGRDEAIVKQAFPEGSTSFLFPHYKLDIVGGDKNVAVALKRVGVERQTGIDAGKLDASLNLYGDPGRHAMNTQAGFWAGYWTGYRSVTPKTKDDDGPYLGAHERAEE